MSSSAVDGSEGKSLTDSEQVLVISSGAIASVDLSLEDCVQGADGATSLEGELSSSTGKSAYTASVERISGLADALSVGDDLVGSASVAVSAGVKKFISLTLTNAHGSLLDLS